MLDRGGLDLMVVIGGYNSSNTISLAALCDERVRTFHVSDATCIDVEAGSVRHVRPGSTEEIETSGWLTTAGPLRVGANRNFHFLSRSGMGCSAA